MVDTTNREKVLAAIRMSSRPLDDDQVSERTGIRPRQQVNQICHGLERQGVIRRHFGPDQKIVNEMIRDAPRAVGEDSVDRDGTVIARAADHPPPPGHSQEQRDAERIMLDLLGRQLGVVLEPARITVPSGAYIEVDGADAGRSVLVECWAHQGRPKVAQKHKVLADALKLAWIATTIQPRPRLILCLSDESAARPFLPAARSWAAQALQDFGISICLVDLPSDVRNGVVAAQRRQYR